MSLILTPDKVNEALQRGLDAGTNGHMEIAQDQALHMSKRLVQFAQDFSDLSWPDFRTKYHLTRRHYQNLGLVFSDMLKQEGIKL